MGMQKPVLLALTQVLLLLLTSVTLHPLPAQAADQQRLSVEDLLSLPAISQYRVNGNDVAWVERERQSWNLYVARAPEFTARRLTHFLQDDGAALNIVGFGARGEIFFTRGRAGFNPSHDPAPVTVGLYSATEGRNSAKLLLADISEGFQAALVAGDGRSILFARQGDVYRYQPQRSRNTPSRLFQVRGTISAMLLSPDGRRLAFVSDRSVYQRGKYSFVGVYDMDAGTITYMAPGLGMDQNLTWSPDSKRLAFVRFGYEPRTWRFSHHREGAPFDIVVADAATGEGGAVFTSQIGYGARFHGFGASGYSGLGGSYSLIWLSNDDLLFPYEKTGWKQFCAVPADGGSVRAVTSGAFEINGARPSSDRTRVYYWANSEKDLARLGLYYLDVSAGLRPVPVPTGGPGDMPFNALPLAAGGFVYKMAGPRQPTRLRVRTADGRDKPISSRHQISAAAIGQLPAPQAVYFTSRDGMRIPAVLYQPAGPKGERSHPVIVHSHGGPRSQVYPVWNTGFGYRTVLPYFASKGYYVLSVNFRSGTGYGLDFREPDSYGGRGAGDVEDFLAAADYLVNTYPAIDPERLLIYGHSYGGHNVTNALARSDKYAAGISSAGVGDWVVEMEKDFRETLQFNIPQRLLLEQQAHQSSAIASIDQWGDEPILFLHGDNDRSAALQQSLELYLALRRRGKTAEAVIFPGESHGFHTFKARQQYMRAVETFADKYIGGIR